MHPISDNPTKKNRILFTTIWMLPPTYLFLVGGFLWVFIPFICFGLYFLIYLGSKIKDVYVSENTITILHRGDLREYSINQILSLKHYNRGVYKVIFKEKNDLGYYVLFYGKYKKFFAKDGHLEILMKQVNT